MLAAAEAVAAADAVAVGSAEDGADGDGAVLALGLTATPVDEQAAIPPTSRTRETQTSDRTVCMP